MEKWKPPMENLPNILDRLKEGSFFPLFFQLVNSTDFADILTESVITVFTPVEDTLDFITEKEHSILKEALNDETKAKEIIGNHIVYGAYSLRELLDIKELETISGKKIKVDVSCNIREDFEFLIDNACFVDAKINDCEIETANIVCYNGFIHTIKGVIL